MKSIGYFLCMLLACSIVSAGESAWFATSLPWNKVLPDPVNMSKRSLDAPAGKHGYIEVVGDRLQFKDGTPARFWGVVMAMSNSAETDGIPPSKKDAATVAARLASYGINHVRIVGFDGTAAHALENWIRTGKLESKQLNRLDYFISKLREQGIYYSLSINNSSPALFRNTSVIPENDGVIQRYRKYKNTRLFEEDATDLMAEWIGAFYSRKNPYTGLTYARDPANIYVAAVNEDTAYKIWFTKGKRLDDYWRKRLDEKFSRYLLEKYKSEEALLKVWSSPIMPSLLPGESLSSLNINIRPKVPATVLSQARINDTHEYLIGVDVAFYVKVRKTLEGIGYKGLFTGTNKWYGNNNLYANYVTGNYIDGHDYFGRSGRTPKKESIGGFVLGNQSYLDRMMKDPGGRFGGYTFCAEPDSACSSC